MKLVRLLILIASLDGTHAATSSVVGSLSSPNQVYSTVVTLTRVSELNVQTASYGSGGFDPIVSIFAGSGSSATLLDSNDDGACPPGVIDPNTRGCLDSTLTQNALQPGSYTIVVTVAPNAPNGPTLGDGFSGGGSLVDVYGSSRTSNFAFTVTTITANPCLVGSNGTTTISSLQLIMNEALGVTNAVDDLNGDGVVNVADVEAISNAVLGLGCSGS
jgi:hypothetical protein